MFVARIKKIISKKTVILFAGIVLVGFGSWEFSQRYEATHNPTYTNPAEVVTHSTDKPDEAPLESCENFRTNGSDPAKIYLPSLNETGCIQKVGIDQHGAVAVPSNVHLAGWFVNSKLPGESGVSLIDGHVSGRYSDAIFKNLVELKPGDKYSIEFGDSSTKQFEVVSTDLLSIEETTKRMLVQHVGIEQQLNLITCGGNFDKQSQQYDKRVLIISKYTE